MAIKRRVLCIEDDRETAELIAEELTGRGYSVRLADNGRAGYSAIVKDPPDLILADIMMPIISGFEILERLTVAGLPFSALPIIFLTGLTDPEVKLKARRLGAGDFVTKPIDFDRLEAIIGARLAGIGRHRTFPVRADMSDRGAETLTWAARGKTSAQIAILLGVSKRTVDFSH
jgi:DNA-binding response OmpR family regulator